MTQADRSSLAPVVWEHNQVVMDEIIRCIESGDYCALLGPRFCGKSTLLRHVQKSMEDDSLPCIYIDLFDIQAPTQGGFFARLAAEIADSISKYTDRQLPIPEEELTSAGFRYFLSGWVDYLASNLIVIFDHLEDLPIDLNRSLLTSLRAIYMEQQDKEFRFIAIVSGALSLAGLTVGETSPFHGIARRLILGDLNEGESKTLVNTHLASADVQVSPTARSLLLEATRGNPHLIKYICKYSLAAAAKTPSKQVSTQTVKKIVHDFLRVDAPKYDPLQEATRLIEDDPDLLQCILRLLKSEVVPLRELPLPLLPDLDPLYLTGMVEKVGEDSYRIRNEIYRQYLNEYFDAARAGYLLTVSGRWDAAIGHLESSIVSGNEQSRADLLAATINSMYASKTEEQAAYYLIRGLSAAFRATEIYIWLLTRDGRTLELLDQKGTTIEGILPIEIQEISIDADRIETRSYRQACILREHQVDICTKYVIPLMIPGQSPVGVVTLCHPLEVDTQTEQRKQEFQLQSFLNQAARAVYEVESRRKQEARSREQDRQLEKQTHQLFLLQRISTLSQTIADLEKISHLILTAITAHFGLGFNRAWLFLIDYKTNCLVGRMGIGSFTQEEAYQAWARSEKLSFDDYVLHLFKDQIEYNEIDQATRELKIPISESNHDLFSMSVYQRHTFQWADAPGHWHALPREFMQRFEPGEMLVTPLVFQNNCLGLIAVDSKFLPRTYTETDELLLKTFANQMATAIVNIQQRDHEKQRLRLEETLRDVSLIIGSSLRLNEVLHRILEEMRKVLPFDTASIQLANEELRNLKIIANKGFSDPKRVEALVFPLEGNYPNVLVYEKREPLHFEDVQENFPHFSNPYYQATHVHGWLGAPLIINDRVIGVITLDSNTPGIYTSEHDRMAVLFAGQASVAIDNARLYETERKAENNLRLILDTVSIMSKVKHSEAGLSALAERIVSAQPVTFCSILLLDETKQNLILKVAYPNSRPQSTWVKWKPTIGQRISLTQSSIMPHLVSLPEPHTFQQGQTIMGIEVIQYLQQYVSLEEKIRSILTIPLKAGSEVIGICILGETRSWSRSPFDEGKVELVSSMVTQGTVFVDRLRAHEATQNKLLMVERLRSIGEDLVAASSSTAKSILDKVVRAACDVTGASSAIIYPWDKQMRTYETEKIVHVGLSKKKSFSDKVRDEEGSMTGIVVKNEMVVVDDIQKGMDRSEKIKIWANQGGFLGNEVIQAFVGVSLRGGEDALGVLFVNFLEPHFFRDSELEAVNLFANQAAIAIENARLYEDLARRLDESVTLQKVSISLAETRDLNLVLNRVMQAALELIHADEGNILFYDEATDEFQEDAFMSLGAGLPLQAYKTRVRQRIGYSYEIIKSLKPILIPDTARDSRVNPVTREKGRVAVLGVPLIGRDKPVGVLWVYWKTSLRVLDQDERLLMALGSQAAIYIENVRLFDKLLAENVRRNEESKALQEVSISFTEPMGINKGLYRVLQAALKLVDGDDDSILFYDEARDEFDTKALMCAGSDQPMQTYQSKVRQKTGLAYQIVKERKPVFISDTLLEPRISQVAIDKGRRATVGMPLLDDNGPVGVLWVNWNTPRLVSSMEASLLTALASLATLAIKGARRYAEIQRRSAHLEAVHEAGKVISAASVGLGRQEVLDSILEQAVEYVTGVDGWKASVGTIHLVEEETNELVLKSVFPRQYPQSSIAKFDHISLDAQKTKNGKIGVIGRAFHTRQAQLVPDVSKDNDYIVHNEDTKSELAIPLLDNGKVIGVMDVESPHLDAFDELDKDSLSLLVDLAVVALHNTEQAEQLTRSNAVGLMGAWGAEIVHDINREVGYIRRDVKYLRQQPGFSEVTMEVLDSIDECAEHLALPEIPERLPGYEAVPSSATSDLDSAIHSAVEAFQSGHLAIKIHFKPGCPQIRVAMHERFVLAMVRNLLRNADYALSNIQTEKIIHIYSRVEDSMAVLEIEDSGPGLRPDVIPFLFKRLIPHKDGRKGRGLLLVGFIVQQHGGRIEIIPNEGKGAFFRFVLPLASSEEKNTESE
jgi:GAF domain-containing protein